MTTTNAERNAAIVAAHRTGKTYAAIAREVGVSAVRVRQLCKTADLRERRSGTVAALGVRAFRLLCRMGFYGRSTRADVLARFSVDDIRRGDGEWKHLGHKTAAEIIEWLETR